MLWVLLILFSLAIVFSPAYANNLILTIHNQKSAPLYLSYQQKNSSITPRPNYIAAKTSITVTCKTKGIQALTAAISAYTTPAKLVKTAVIVLKQGRVIVTMDRHCQVRQQSHHADVTFYD